MTLAVIYVAGFAGVLVLFSISQLVKMMEDGEIAPKHAWPWFVAIAAAWPILVGVFVVGSLLLTVFSSSKRIANVTIRKEDYAFTIEAHGVKWDVYHFKNDIKQGTLAFCQKDGKWHIGLLQAGWLNEIEAKAKLEESERKEAN